MIRRPPRATRPATLFHSPTLFRSPFLTEPAQVVTAAGGDIAQANLKAGLVDKLATRIDFGKRVASIAGAGDDKVAGSYDALGYDPYVQAPPGKTGRPAGRLLAVAGRYGRAAARPAPRRGRDCVPCGGRWDAPSGFGGGRKN